MPRLYAGGGTGVFQPGTLSARIGGFAKLLARALLAAKLQVGLTATSKLVKQPPRRI